MKVNNLKIEGLLKTNLRFDSYVSLLQITFYWFIHQNLFDLVAMFQSIIKKQIGCQNIKHMWQNKSQTKTMLMISQVSIQKFVMSLNNQSNLCNWNIHVNSRPVIISSSWSNSLLFLFREISRITKKRATVYEKSWKNLDLTFMQ